MNKTEQIVFDKSIPLAAKCDCEVYDVEFLKEGGGWVLRIYIDKPEGIGLEDCEKVSHLVSDMLDEEDPISQNYCLEVSSPGINRALKRPEHFEKALGQSIEIKLFAPQGGSKSIIGELIEYNTNGVIIKTTNETKTVSVADIAKASLYFEF